MKHSSTNRFPRAASKAAAHGGRKTLAVIVTTVAVAALLVAGLLIPTWRAGETGAGWSVGQLRSDGLRIVVTGRSDASHVLDPNRFSQPDVRHGYWIATQIPALLNQLYCWCGCENRGQHRSNLQCFEDTMATDCRVCLGTAEIAYKLRQQGVTDPAKIQAAVDAAWQPR